MAEAVAGLLASALVGIAKDKLRSAIAEQASLLWNFGNDLEDMMDVLETISAALEDAERRSVKEKLVQLWLKRLKNVAMDISDMLKDYQETSDHSRKSSRYVGAKNVKTRVLSCIPSAYKMISIANRMKSLRKELRKIDMEFGNFKFINTQGTSNNVQHYDKFETTSYFLPEVEGREGEKQEIINLIHASSNHDESETVIVSIYALGDMGKTTLAQLVYNDVMRSPHVILSCAPLLPLHAAPCVTGELNSIFQGSVVHMSCQLGTYLDSCIHLNKIILRPHLLTT